MSVGGRDVRVLDDERTLARAVAERVVNAGNAAIAARGRFELALAGGSTPKAAHQLLASPEFRERLDWNRVRFFFGDERCVPPGDAQSNYKMAKDTLFDGLSIAHDRVFRMRGEDDPDHAASVYAAILLRELPADNVAPTLDLIMLGMGPDGHTASLFPGTDPFEDDELLAKAAYVEKLASHRITLTPRTIGAAREVVVATAGEAKAEALAAVLEGPYEPSRYPSQILSRATGRVSWLVDKAAAARLTQPS
jgi:6-phosphogluconolactonase